MLDLWFGVSLSEETMLRAPILPLLICIFILLLFLLLSDFFFLDLDFRNFPNGEDKNVVLDLIALSRQL